MTQSTETIVLSDIEKMFLMTNVRDHKTEGARDQATTKTSLIKFFIGKGLITDEEKDQIERLVFETKVLRPNVIPTVKIQDIINQKLRSVGMGEL